MTGAIQLSMARDVLRAMRPSQWVKNAVVLAAFFFAVGDRTQSVAPGMLSHAVAAVVFFCLVSSGIYLFNDILDREADQFHPLKQFRPIAAGRVPVRLAAFVSALLLAGSLTGALLLSLPFAVTLAAYGFLQILYSICLKKVALLDVFVIAIGFVLRAAAGGMAVNVWISPWLLLCAFLLALFLALCKRRHEKIFLNGADTNHRRSLGHYSLTLLDQLITVVSAATIISYSLYTLWPDTTHRFNTPYLSLTIPIVVFGVFRYLDLVYRGEGGDRPERCLLTDGPLLFGLLLYGLTVQGVFFCRPH
jgi:4-hydroxybenzoate polyprenyltransferase